MYTPFQLTESPYNSMYVHVKLHTLVNTTRAGPAPSSTHLAGNSDEEVDDGVRVLSVQHPVRVGDGLLRSRSPLGLGGAVAGRPLEGEGGGGGGQGNVLFDCRFVVHRFALRGYRDHVMSCENHVTRPLGPAAL